MEEQNSNLQTVQECIREAGFYPKTTKCHFAREHRSEDRPQETGGHGEVPRRKDTSLLGILLSLIRAKVFNCGTPLTHAEQERCSIFLDYQFQATFENIKMMLTTAPVLEFPLFHPMFILETGASGVGPIAVLAQK
jgi:hypothetical protein